MMIDWIQRDTDSDWKRIANEHPYWGVLSANEYRGQSLSLDARAKFFASGNELIEKIRALIIRRIDGNFNPKRSLDFGCGVGRLLIPIAKFSQHAVGVDVAPTMLDLTQKYLEAAKISNATVVLGDDGLTAIEGVFDFVNTYIVMQHIPPTRGYRILRRLLQILSIGGIGSFQLTYAKSRQLFTHESPRSPYYRREGRTLIDLAPTLDSEPPEGTITMFDYDLNQLFAMLSEVTSRPIITLQTNHGGHLGVHMLFVRTH
jgi:SAM-dependent methyltransferase